MLKKSNTKSSWFVYVVLGILIYLNSFDNAFQFDDYDFIVNNYNIRDLFNIPAIWNALSHPSRFIGFLSFAVNFNFGEFDVFGYHIVNTAIHILNAGLVFLITRQIFYLKPFSNKKVDAPTIAFVTGLLFLVHPLQTQAVGYISQRFTSLATLFYLISFFSYLRYYSTRKLIFFVIMFITALLGMFTKQIVFTLPILIIIFDQIFLKEDKCFNKKQIGIVALLLLIVPWCMDFGAGRIFGMTTLSGSHDGDVVNAAHYFLTQSRVILLYLKLFLFPVGQTLDHDVALSTSLFDGRVLFSGAILIAFIIFGLKQFKQKPIVTFCVAWFFITIAVSSSIIPIHHVAFEHRMYLPSVGLCILVSYFLVTKLDKGQLYIPVLMVMVVALCVLTVRRNAIWDNPILLWGDVVQKAPDKSRGYRSLAVEYMNQDDFLKALNFIQKAIIIYPEYFEAYRTRGRIYYMIEDYTNALLDFNYVLSKRPNNSLALKDRADLWVRKNMLVEALDDYNKAIEISPQNPHIYNGRAQVYARNQQIELGLKDINQAIAIDPYHYEFYNNRGILRSMAGKHAEALDDFRKSLSLNDKQPGVEKNIATVQELLNAI